MNFDLFVSHASEDKERVVRPLAEALVDRGLRVWYDEFELKLGDSLSETIDRGLATSSFGVVVLSPNFFHKQWTKRELRGLVAREIEGKKVILPVWHQVTREMVLEISPPLADIIAANTDDGIERVVERIVEVVDPSKMTDDALERADKLCNSGYVQAAVVTAAIYLGNFLREKAVQGLGYSYFRKAPLRTYPLRSLFELLINKGIIRVRRRRGRVDWVALVHMRNVAVHSDDQSSLSPERCRWYLRQVRFLVEINPEEGGRGRASNTNAAPDGNRATRGRRR